MTAPTRSRSLSPPPISPRTMPADALHEAAQTRWQLSYSPPSPPRPPVSPITPVATIAQLAPISPVERGMRPPAVDFIAQPPPRPIIESENTDVIALRSAIAILQIQRDKSKRDMHTLKNIKNAAVAQPEAFVKELKSGCLHPTRAANDALGPTLDSTPASKFGPLPGPQNIFRCPPINWAKYHVIGESLDKLHAEQQARPVSGEPRQTQAPVHVVAAPYSPFTDQLPPSQKPG